MPELDRHVQDLAATLQKEFWEAMGKPKAERRPTLAKDYMDTASALPRRVDKLSGALAAAVNHQDATIDQLLAIKQIAWLLRNTAGEASLIVSTGLSKGKRHARDQGRLHQVRRRHRGRLERARTDRVRACSCRRRFPAPWPPTKTAYFEPQYLCAARPAAQRSSPRGEKAGADRRTSGPR